jgi:uncharacterized small protein (DUF1192 family)
MLTDDDEEPRGRPRKPRPLDDLSIGDLNAYVAELQAEIARVEAAITAKQAHMTAVAALFKTPD